MSSTPPIAGRPGEQAIRPRRAPEAWAWFAAWVCCGAALALGVLSAMTIGIVVLPAALVATAVLAAVPRSRASWYGLIAGGSLPVFYVAWLNRGGPSTCPGFGTVHPGELGTSCTDTWSPWPFVVVGIGLCAIGVTAQVLADRRARRHPTA